MRFWLRWAIVTLPVVMILVLWALSYQKGWDAKREGHHNIVIFFLDRGEFYISALWDSESNLSNGSWTLLNEDFATQLPGSSFLGFGYESILGPSLGNKALLIEFPIWIVTLVAVVPPVWLYRRQRKNRKTGFPIEPLTVNSKESILAQTD